VTTDATKDFNFGKCQRIRRYIRRLPVETRQHILNEVEIATICGYDHTGLRKVMPGEEPKKTEWICSGKTWEADAVKKGAIQMCPREDLQYIRYHFAYDMVQRYCPRCAEYLIANPDDVHFEHLDIPIECPKNGWRPDPMPKGWKP
jgi:hypothetical protein